MDFSKFLQQIYFDNTVENYLWVLLAIVIVILLMRYIAGIIVGLFYKLIKRWLPDADAAKMKSLLLGPIQLFFFWIAAAFIIQTLNFPKSIETEIFGFSLKQILTVSYQFIVAVSLTWIVLRLIDFVYLVLFVKVEKTETKTDDQALQFFKEFLKLGVLVLSILFILGNIFHFNISALLAGAGIAGLAIALAAKESLENLLASFTIFLEKPFVVGDFVQLNETGGIVERVGFRSTRLRTSEKTFVTIPNRNMINSVLDNQTLRTKRRIQFHIGLVYGTNAEQIKSIMNDIRDYITNDQHTEGEITVVFDLFGASSLDILIQYYLNNSSWPYYMEQKQELNFKIMEIVAQHGSDFAYPTTTVHLENFKKE